MAKHFRHLETALNPGIGRDRSNRRYSGGLCPGARSVVGCPVCPRAPLTTAYPLWEYPRTGEKHPRGSRHRHLRAGFNHPIRIAERAALDTAPSSAGEVV